MQPRGVRPIDRVDSTHPLDVAVDHDEDLVALDLLVEAERPQGMHLPEHWLEAARGIEPLYRALQALA